MTTYLKCCIVFVGVFLMSGCALPARVDAAGGHGGQLLFCEVAQNFEKYRGVKVAFSARYVSDGRHEEVLESSACGGGRRIVDVGKRGGSESVARFYEERGRVCSERSAIYLCNTSAEIDVLGTVRQMSGEFVFDIEEVVGYYFSD